MMKEKTTFIWMESKKNSRRVSSFLVHTEKKRSDKWSSFRRDEDMLLNMSSPCVKGFLAGSVVKNPPANTGDTGSIPGLGRFLGGENGNPLQYSCLGNPMNRGAWLAIVCGIVRVGHNLATKTTDRVWVITFLVKSLLFEARTSCRSKATLMVFSAVGAAMWR